MDWYIFKIIFKCNGEDIRSEFTMFEILGELDDWSVVALDLLNCINFERDNDVLTV